MGFNSQKACCSNNEAISPGPKVFGHENAQVLYHRSIILLLNEKEKQDGDAYQKRQTRNGRHDDNC